MNNNDQIELAKTEISKLRRFRSAEISEFKQKGLVNPILRIHTKVKGVDGEDTYYVFKNMSAIEDLFELFVYDLEYVIRDSIRETKPHLAGDITDLLIPPKKLDNIKKDLNSQKKRILKSFLTFKYSATASGRHKSVNLSITTSSGFVIIPKWFVDEL